MAIIDKVKELGEEIVKSVEEAGIKEKAKSATLLITEVVENGVKEIETRFEENMNRLEAEKQERQRLQRDIERQVIEQFDDEQTSLFERVTDTELQQLMNELNEKIVTLYRSSDQLRIGFGSFIAHKCLVNLMKPPTDEITSEYAVAHYYDHSKQYFLLTNQYFYFKAKHPVQGLVYTGRFNVGDINRISFEASGDSSVLLVNQVPILVMDDYNSSLLEQFINRVKTRRFEVSPFEVSHEIFQIIQIQQIPYFVDLLETNQSFLFFAHPRENEYILCTEYGVLILKTEFKNKDYLVNMIRYEDICHVIIDEQWEQIPLLHTFTQMFSDSTLDLVLDGSKITIYSLHPLQAQNLMTIINAKKQQLQKVTDPLSTNDEIIRLIKALAELKEQGILTEEEFITKKTQLLSRL